jgi:predicted ATP-dependent endonuclease of OLD family
MYQVLRTISQGKDQAIYSTHSSLLVDITYFDHICVVNKSVVDKRYETRIMQLSMQKMIDDLKARHTNSSPTELSMRDRYSHAYNPLRNEGFFARKIILVEGLSEEYCFPVYADALGYNLDVNGVSVINAGGKGIIDRLLRVFNEFGIPCYVIFDGDKNTNDNNLKKSTKELLNLLQCKEKYPTPTIIDKTFSVFETKFEDVMRTEISEYESFKSQAKEELGLGEAESKPLIARFIARQVVEKGKKEGDPGKYVPNSIQKIIPNVKELIWSGSLLKMST